MSGTVLVPIPVTSEMAEVLRDDDARIKAGEALAYIVGLPFRDLTLLDVAIAAVRLSVAAAGGIPDEELEAELVARKRERHHLCGPETHSSARSGAFVGLVPAA